MEKEVSLHDADSPFFMLYLLDGWKKRLVCMMLIHCFLMLYFSDGWGKKLVCMTLIHCFCLLFLSGKRGNFARCWFTVVLPYSSNGLKNGYFPI